MRRSHNEHAREHTAAAGQQLMRKPCTSSLLEHQQQGTNMASFEQPQAHDLQEILNNICA